MIRKLTLGQDGQRVVVALPKELADRCGLSADDTVLAVETDGGILLAPYDQSTDRALSIVRSVAEDYRGALRKVAT